MMRLRSRISAATLGLALLLSSAISEPVSCQENVGFNGWLHLSSRILSLSGGSNYEGKYSEDFDYQQGFQLAGLQLNRSNGVQDFGLEAYGWGEDPYSTLTGWFNRAGIFRLKFGGYNARYFHTTASYVEDYGLDSLPYNYSRRGRYAELALTFGSLPDIYIRYDRFRRDGTNLLVWNIEDEKRTALSPADETSTSLQVATSLPIAFASVDLSYTLYSIDNRYGAAIGDTSAGLEGRPSLLYDYSHIITDSGSLPVLKANITAPVGRAVFRFGYSSSSGTIDKALEERELGLDQTGAAVDTSFSVIGSLDRSFSIMDAGVSLSILRGLTADLSMRQTGFEVTGGWEPAASNVGVDNSISTTRLSGKFIWNPMRGVSVDLGGANITRTFEDGALTDLETTTTDLVWGFTYSRQSWFNLRLSRRTGDIENPYTRLSPTERSYLRSILNLMPLDWLKVSLSYVNGKATRYYSSDETVSQHYFNARTSDVSNATIGLSFDKLPVLEKASGYIGYTLGTLGMNIPISRSSPPFPAIYDYDDETHAVNGWIGYELSDGFSINGNINWYRTNGQWPLTRYMWQVGAVKDLGFLSVHVDYRSFSLDQIVDDRDNYEGSLITIGLSRGF